MSILTTIIASVAAIILAIFLASDSDFYLQILPYNEAQKPFSGQVVWITGASSGIGAALAESLAAGGAQVIISARRVHKLEEMAELCAKIGPRPVVIPLDVTNESSRVEAYHSIIERFGHVDIVILNAGRSQRLAAVDTPLEETRELLELNFLSAVALTKLVLPPMIERRRGHLVIMSSVAGKMGTPISSSYSASKFALHGYFDALRAEVDQFNVSVSLICPGPVDSEIAQAAVRSHNNIQIDEGKKMPTARAAYLMTKGIHHRLAEMWIALQPILSVTFLAYYCPALGRLLFTKFSGPSRVRMLKTGGTLYDFTENLGVKK